ncbi:response regulator [Paenibacillus barcinonensis]|uniref:Response regulator n=1 Tax=Paenibacillus barcinonensis TaxID=198119 RepID=A0A2V4V9U0_PAEBA|nr:response regulator [Paenibacillus barcinonensis]PYE45646.1 response regulator receiver domain-containing protein [Paenibacillus barcinonensis]QKS56172.1 response regulator [Paenibacillus barcinonensis]
MPNTATLQREAVVDVYRSVEKGLKETGAEACGLMFIHCAGRVQPEQQVRTHLEQAGYASFEVWQDSKTQAIAVLLPGLSLDEVHYEGLRIKHELQESVSGADPQITLASFPPGDRPSKATIQHMAESSKLVDSSEIHIYTLEHTTDEPERILIVDNDPTVREFLQLRLKMQGYETYEAVDGLAALDLIEKVTPDLVLTELNLYGIDGLPFIHHIQKLEMEQPPKIVVLTEQRVEQTISQCFRSGVDDYMTKPFSPVELDARIRRCLQ